jgi:hypothetical protein
MAVTGLTAAQLWNVFGLVLSLIGILLLFVFGMPFRVRSRGYSYELREEVDEQGLRLDAIFGALGWLGLILVVCGTLAQIRASLL